MVRERFDFTDNRRDRVRRAAVHLTVADALKVGVANELIAMVRKEVEEAGGIAITPYGRRMFCRMKPRASELIPQEQGPNQGGRDAALGRLRRVWWARVAKEGHDLEHDNGRLRELPHYREYARDINAAFFEKLTSDYWTRRAELDICGLYALEGLSIREIAAKLNMGRDSVHRIVKAWVGQLAEEQETSE